MSLHSYQTLEQIITFIWYPSTDFIPNFDGKCLADNKCTCSSGTLTALPIIDSLKGNLMGKNSIFDDCFDGYNFKFKKCEKNK